MSIKSSGVYMNDTILAVLKTVVGAEVLTEYFGFPVEVPLQPELSGRQERALGRYRFLRVFLPAVTEERYPKHAVVPDWRQFRSYGAERIPLPGKWVAIETLLKPNYADRGREEDPLMAALRANRLCNPYSSGHHGVQSIEEILPKVADELGFAADQVMVPSFEEWNLAANLFNWLCVRHAMPLPDLGETDTWEWCRNACGTDQRILAGRREQGGLSAVWCRDGQRYGRGLEHVGFRVLVVLN